MKNRYCNLLLTISWLSLQNKVCCKHKCMAKKLKIAGICAMLCLISVALQAQTIQEKRERRANLTIKEWNTLAGHKNRYLDHITKYNAKDAFWAQYSIIPKKYKEWQDSLVAVEQLLSVITEKARDNQSLTDSVETCKVLKQHLIDTKKIARVCLPERECSRCSYE